MVNLIKFSNLALQQYKQYVQFQFNHFRFSAILLYSFWLILLPLASVSAVIQKMEKKKEEGDFFKNFLFPTLVWGKKYSPCDILAVLGSSPEIWSWIGFQIILFRLYLYSRKLWKIFIRLALGRRWKRRTRVEWGFERAFVRYSQVWVLMQYPRVPHS